MIGSETGKTSDPYDDDLDEVDDGDDFWHTSVGKFKFSLDSLPQPLQYIYQLLKVHIESRINLIARFLNKHF